MRTVYKKGSGNNTPNLVIPENNISMHGDPFQFDEATNTIDGYIQKVKQVAALLDYGDQQILELFKNTLPSSLSYMLYHINNLREAAETAKRTLAKEQWTKEQDNLPPVCSCKSIRAVPKTKIRQKRKCPLVL